MAEEHRNRSNNASPPPSPRPGAPTPTALRPILGLNAIPISAPTSGAGGGSGSTSPRPPSPRGAVLLRDPVGRGRGRGRGSFADEEGVAPPGTAAGVEEGLVSSNAGAAPSAVSTAPSTASNVAPNPVSNAAPSAVEASPAKPMVNKALLNVRARSRAVDSPPPASHIEHRPLVQGPNKTRRNSMATLFTCDPVLRMVQLICQYPFFVEKLAHLVDSAEVQRLADALVNVSVPFGRTLFLIKAMIQSEFTQNKSQVSSILRGNSATSKVMGSFSFFVGMPYLESTVGEFVRKVVGAGESLTFEVDPAKETSAEKRSKNRVVLKEWTCLLVESLTSGKSLASLPPEICSIALFTAENAKVVCPEQLSALVGGYFILRLVNPVLVAPEAYHIVSAPPTPHVRRNLTLVSKLLQNISNGAVSSSKEAFMADFADFVKVQSEAVNGLLQAIAKNGVDTTDRPAIPVELADVGFIEGKHLWYLNHLLQQKSEDLSAALAALPRNTLAELELINILKLVTRDQEPPAVKSKTVQPWLGKHIRTGTITKKGDKKKKKHKKHFRLELTRHFLYFFLIEGDVVSSEPCKCVPMSGLQCSLKQVKKETTLELVYFGRTHEFVNHESSELVSVWAQAISAALESDVGNPQSGNERFVSVQSKGAVSDVLTAYNSIPRVMYSVVLQPKASVRPPAISLSVSAFDLTWTVHVTVERAQEMLVGLANEEEDLVLPQLPSNLLSAASKAGGASAEQRKTDYALGVDPASGAPLGGLRVLRDWLSSFVLAMQSCSLASHSKSVLDLLQINSPFRAVASSSLVHLRWIHRYYEGGLAVKNRSGNNVLMQMVSVDGGVPPEQIDIVKFLIDSKGVNVKDVDSEGNTALHKAIVAKNFGIAVVLAEMGVGHCANKAGQYPLHVLASSVSKDSQSSELETLISVLSEECPLSLLALDKRDRSPLALAISRQAAHVAALLLKGIVNATANRPKPLSEFDSAGSGSPLFLALSAGMNELAIEMLERKLLSATAVVGASGPDGASVLHLAAQVGNVRVVELMLKSASENAVRQAMCAVRDKSQMTPLLCAGLGGNLELMRMLLPYSDSKVQDSQQRSLFLCAAIGGKVDCVELALQQEGVDVNSVDSSGRTALVSACREGSSSVAQLLIARGANLALADSSGITCLMAACMAHDLECVKLLLAAKGGVDLVKNVDKNRRDALHFAVESFPSGSDNVELVALLLSSGVKVSSGAVLFAAVNKGSLPLTSLLLKNGADPNAVDRQTGSTALHFAVSKGLVSIIGALLQAGAWSSVKNSAGETPLSIAVSQKKKDVVILLSEKQGQ